MEFETEPDAASDILVGHARVMAKRLRQLPLDKWDFAYAPGAPTPRTLANHALSWLRCDRQHLENPDVSSHHLIPDPPKNEAELCADLEHEADLWEALLARLNEQDMLSVRNQFGNPDYSMNVRGYIAHMIQNTIYKHGQFSYVFFALGLDGDIYDAQFPNQLYREETAIQG